MMTIPLPWSDWSLLVALPWPDLPLLLRVLLILCICLLPLILLVLLYRYELCLVSRSMARALLGLRLSVLAFLLALVCLQPILAQESRHLVPGRIVLAVDRSASMTLHDPQRPVADRLRLARSLNLHSGLVPADRLERWIEDHEANRPPRLGPQGEPDDVAGRHALDTLLSRVDALSRTQIASRLLADVGGRLMERLESRHQVDILEFDRQPREVPAQPLRHGMGDTATGIPLTESQRFTNLHAPLALGRHQRQTEAGALTALVLLSDGQHNLGPSPTRAAEQLGKRQVPVYAILLGEERSPPDAALVSLRGPDHTLFKGVETDLEVRVKIAGLAAQPFLLQIFRQGQDQPLAEKLINHDGKDRIYTESLPVQLDEAGTHELSAAIRALKLVGRETRTDNNRQATTVNVAEDRARVLLVDGEARWEYHYLATALLRDRLVDLSRVVFQQPRLGEPLSEKQLARLRLPGQQWPLGDDALSDYACIILGDVTPDDLPLARRQQLERYVAESGGTLVIVAGKRAMPLGYPETTPTSEPDPLRRLLPVESLRPLKEETGFALTLTPAAAATRFMKLDADSSDSARLWAGFPRPWGWGVAGQAKPGATALASWFDPAEQHLPAQERERRNVVVARHNYGFGRVVFLGLDSTWRWRYKVGDEIHHCFWGQLIRWAAADRPLMAGNRLVRFGTPQPVYRPGDAIEVVARLSEKLGDLRPDLLAGARILRLPDQPTEKEQSLAVVPLQPLPGQPRARQGQVRDLPPGRYAVELAIPQFADQLLDETRKAPLRANFTVQADSGQELVALEANRGLLEELARVSGGRVFRPWEIDELVKALLDRGETQIERSEQRLWQWWGMLVLLVLLLSLEWLLRKLAGLP